MSQLVEMNGLTVEQKNGKVFVNGQLLTDEQTGAKRPLGLLMAASCAIGLFVGYMMAMIDLAA